MLVKIEKNPSVITFKGTDNKFKIGFINIKSIASASPPNKYDINPPLTSNPATICEVRKRDRLFTITDLKKDFIYLS